MTQVIAGSRFLDLDADAFDCDVEYTPRHLRAVTLSPDLQQALDAAFARDTMPTPEPVPGPTPVAPEPVVEQGAAHSHLSLVVPELVVYPPVMPDDIFRPVAAAPVESRTVEDAPVEGVPVDVEAESMPFVDDIFQGAGDDDPFEDDDLDDAPMAARVLAEEPVEASTPAAAISFPDPAAYAAKRFSGNPGATAPSGGLFRRRVDISRLMVPVRAEAVGS
ncbi:MAG: hypothetical protein QM779_09325 [Propionicimonas sp.]|uniref:hypothetical protein n=1 Tax=Propionicimonas sp. TaxID=1955623 RepID=UPI003D139ED2